MKDLINFVIYILLVLAWVASIANSIEDGDVFMAVLAFFFFPVGIIHGIGVALGLG